MTVTEPGTGRSTAAAEGPLTSNPPRNGRNAVRGVAFYVVASVLAVAFLFPLVWTFLSSIKSPQEANQSPPTFIPHSLSWANYSYLADYGDGLWTYVRNSLVISGVTVALTVVVAVLAGYGFARFSFPLKGLAFVSILAILMVPYPSLLIALYFLFSRLGLINNSLSVALVLTVFQLPFAVYMMRNSIESYPRELEEAARVDGASGFQVLSRITLPGVLPGIVTVALFAFVASWNEFLAPLIFLSNGSSYTLPIALNSIQAGSFGTVNYGSLQAGIVVAMLPCVVLFIGLQRFYVSGLIAGSLKS